MVNDAVDMVNGRLISPWGYVGCGWAAMSRRAFGERQADALAQHTAVIAREGGRSSTPRRLWDNRQAAAYWMPACPGHDSRMWGRRGDQPPYFFTLLASILMAGSSILVVNAVV